MKGDGTGRKGALEMDTKKEKYQKERLTSFKNSRNEMKSLWATASRGNNEAPKLNWCYSIFNN
jgi:hypothetical protein